MSPSRCGPVAAQARGWLRGSSSKRRSSRSSRSSTSVYRSVLQDQTSASREVDVVIIGGGQAGQAVGHYLEKQTGLGSGRARKLSYVILDSNDVPGGAWGTRWPSLRLFSTRRWSSLPGYPMPGEPDGYPLAAEFAHYLAQYEVANRLNVQRSVKVQRVARSRGSSSLVVDVVGQGKEDRGHCLRFEAKAVVSATGTHSSPFAPSVKGLSTFEGQQLHTADYRHPELFQGKRVAVVGGGNSGAQVLAEVAPTAASATWVTMEPPSFLPPEMSGKDVFEAVAALRKAQHGAIREEDIPSLSKIIQVDPVRTAKERGVYDSHRTMFDRVTPTGVGWADGSSMDVDAIIWATGYNSNTCHLGSLGLSQNLKGEMPVQPGSDGKLCSGVYALGYGNWNGVGSGSIPGAAHFAKRTAASVIEHCLGQYTLSVQDQRFRYQWPSLIRPQPLLV